MVDLIVVGSLNMDLVIRAQRFPRPGETIQGGDLATYPGGKGANQAVAASKQQLDVAMVGSVGQDQFGDRLIQSLASQGVDTTFISRDPQSATGTAVIIVIEGGENSILLSAGANGAMEPGAIDLAQTLFASAETLLLQFEIPMEVVEHAAKVGRDHGLRVIVNPAPGRQIPGTLMEKIDYLLPNETELGLLAGIEVSDLPSAKTAARRILEMGVPQIIVTLGEQGCLVVTATKAVHLPTPQVEVVDTTAAGDSFIGGFVAALHRGRSVTDAAATANLAGALATTQPGAQPSLPSWADVQRFSQEGQQRHE